jgi:hypothetical protein
MPPANLSSYAFIDLPEGEQGNQAARWNDFTPSRWASSAAHDLGRPVASAETWTWIHSPIFRATPLDLKAGADEQFLEGITQIVGHGWPYSPPGVAEPGWFFYAAGALNQHNPWWMAMPDLALYLQRVSFMLRQGSPANDVAVYLPTHDAWAQLAPTKINLWEETSKRLGRRLTPAMLAAGYSFDFVDDKVIVDFGRVEPGALRVADQRFKAIILPGIGRIPPATLRKLEDFARAGGTLIATRRTPASAPGFLNRDSETAEVAALSKTLFVGPSPLGHFVSDEGADFVKTLRALVPPDVQISPASGAVGFVHRRANAAEIYFIANTGNRPVQATASFRIAGEAGEWRDPFSAEISQAEVLSRADGRTAVALNLQPYESRLLIFTRNLPVSDVAKTPPAEAPAPLDLSSGWDVTFEGLNRKIHMDQLHPWTDENDLRFFSGRATYTKTVNMRFLSSKVLQFYLNLGEATPLDRNPAAAFEAWVDSPVREAAEVYVNGNRIGAVWHPPYEVNVTPFIRSGDNEIRVLVGNLAINQMASKPFPNFKELEVRYGPRFSVQNVEALRPIHSGLLGPVHLVARPAPAEASPPM